MPVKEFGYQNVKDTQQGDVSKNLEIKLAVHQGASAHSPDVGQEQEMGQTDVNDPVLYSGKRLKAHDITACLNAGSCQPCGDFVFPTTNGRNFSRTWFFREMPDKTTHKRSWLS